ncbi:uncharacterized protein LOC100901093 [Galendromus occidentalis]|uniref:Uncharacterized protein LOC100901093 n=1 Tax=Galendromus occidentalis TaxID=34638 RepID=A0AAJ6QMA4_9ACAR|nr:uncharacterized protein LOC100901093 [Galendromus occidentalis]
MENNTKIGFPHPDLAGTPRVAPAVFDWDMTRYAGVAAGCVCALFVVAFLYSCVIYRRRRRKAKVRRHVNMMQAGDAALHTPIGPAWTTDLASQVSHSANGAQQIFPQLVSSRPRQPSVDGAFASSGITLKAEVLDSSYYNGTIKKKTRMNKDLAQAIAAFGLPRGGFGSLRKSNRDDEDRLGLPDNMEVVYQERTAV